ncbi:hypothetical protein REB14_05030 [Chryseobacterium sp. ES2]|uniref:DUF6705 domain-containing protein n=1 Tax=Chryseobacterium metallicongregator TaxID=3073042 RepID=A0ABU1E172_9FLAO|nr:DUF6705 family protein [Chryseobacterium sp. ES2]MDR4951548.1 hypothetical protein [Chryseobacterium sp. ES2]
MKTIYNKIAVILMLFFSLISCKAQQIFPLLTSIDKIPNLSHLKDTNNELKDFIGSYLASYNGNQFTLYISKENDKLFDFGDKQIYIDALTIRYTVKNPLGVILQDTKNKVFQDDLLHTIYSQWVTENGTTALFNYAGTNCHVGWGKIILKKVNTTQLSWEYRPNDITTTESKCPSTLDTTIYLPETKDLIFTKQ